MKQIFGTLSDGRTANLYTISSGALFAKITDFGATLVSLLVPDREGNLADVVLGFDHPEGYAASDTYMGATVGRNANRLKNACFVLGNKTVSMPANEGPNSLHSGPDGFERRIWQVASHTDNAITFRLFSPHGDQGLPGNVQISVSYRLSPDQLQITYEALSDRDTLLNMTNHSYFNLAGHDHPEKAMAQTLSMPGRFFLPAGADSIPTGECRSVAGTPMDFRMPKPIGRDVDLNYDALQLQNGYDHTYEVFCNPCAFLSDPSSGRTMAVITDRPGVQLYSANFTRETGKGGVYYGKRSGVCLETQCYPDAVHHPHWPQPIIKAGEKFSSETIFRFTW